MVQYLSDYHHGLSALLQVLLYIHLPEFSYLSGLFTSISNLKKIKDYAESKNIVLILVLYEYPDENRKVYYDMLTNDGFIVYPSIPRAVNAFLKLYEYGKKRTAFKI